MTKHDNPSTNGNSVPVNKTANGTIRDGFRVLHVIVPEKTFNHVKAQAYLSNMRFPDYLTRYLAEAQRYDDHSSQQ